MSVRSSLLVVSLLVGGSAGASTIGYPACMVACSQFCVALCGPCPFCPQCAACIAACTAGCTCFSPETTVQGPNGIVPIANIRAGDLVLTQTDDANGDKFYTSVRSVKLVPGNHSFVTLTLDGQPETPETALTVTSAHAVAVFDSGGLALVPANKVRVGQKMVLRSGTGWVTSVGRSFQVGKYSVSTDHCTMFADGVLTTTDCEDVLRSNALLGVRAGPDRQAAAAAAATAVQGFLLSSEAMSGIAPELAAAAAETA